MWKPFSAGLGMEARSDTRPACSQSRAARRRRRRRGPGCATPHTALPDLARRPRGAAIAASALGIVIPSGHDDVGFTTALREGSHVTQHPREGARVSQTHARRARDGRAVRDVGHAHGRRRHARRPRSRPGRSTRPAAFRSPTRTTSRGFASSSARTTAGSAWRRRAPDPSQPISVPDNYTEDGEGFWWLAEAVVPNAGTGIARFVKESAFDNDVISQDHQVAFSRIRFRFQGARRGRDLPRDASLRRGRDCRRPGSGRARHAAASTSRRTIGCIAPPCGAFPALPDRAL